MNPDTDLIRAHLDMIDAIGIDTFQRLTRAQYVRARDPRIVAALLCRLQTAKLYWKIRAAREALATLPADTTRI